MINAKNNLELDRISELVATKRKYRNPKSFNPEVYFHDCYGITNDDETDAVEVIGPEWLRREFGDTFRRLMDRYLK